MGVVIPHKMRKCIKSSEIISCDYCDNLVNQAKRFSANLNELKRQSPNEFGQRLPCYKTIRM